MASLLICALLIAAPPGEGEIARWAGELGAPRYSDRERALQKLWEAGPAAEAFVRQAAQSPDPEIARRARRLVEKYEWGIFVDTPAEVITEIGRYRGGDEANKQLAIRALIKLGPPARFALGRFASRAFEPVEKALIAEAVDGTLREELPRFLRSGDFAGAERMLEACLDADATAALDHYVAVVSMGRRLAVVRETWAGRLAAGDRTAPQVMYGLARAAGDAPLALRMAEQLKNPELIEQALWDAGDWARLLKSDDVITPDRPHSIALQVALRGYYARRGNLHDEWQRHTDRLKDPAVVVTPDDRQMAGQMLLLLDRPLDGIAKLKSVGQLASVMEIHFARLEYEEAFRIADGPHDAERHPPATSLRLRAARFAAELGQRERATKLFEEIAAEVSAPADLSLFVQLVRTEHYCGYDELAHRHTGKYLEVLAPLAVPEVRDIFAEALAALVPDRSSEAAIWYRYWRGARPDESSDERVRRVVAMLRTPRPSKEPLAEDLAAFARAIPNESTPMTAKLRLALAAGYLAAGDPDAARLEYKKVVEQSPTRDHWLRLADFERRQQRYADAAEAYQQVVQRAPNRPIYLYLQARCLRDAGRAEDARELADTAFRLSGGAFEDRAVLANELRARGLITESRREEQFLLDTIGNRSSYCVDPLTHAVTRAANDGDYARAAELGERRVGNFIRSGWGYVLPETYVSSMSRLRLHHARAELSRSAPAEAVVHAGVALDLKPDNVAVPIALDSRLRAAGRAREADAIYDRVVSLHRARLAEYPAAAMLHNNLAWCAACCRRDLDAALIHARQATELRPDASGYFDTLAEVHHQRGERDLALKAIRRALELEPDRDYLRGQLRRIEAGDRASLPDEPEE